MLKILVVDDDPNIALLIQMTLSRNPEYNITTVHSGEQALELIEEDPPDLVLLDVMMPGIDGFEVCRRIKENEKTKFVPVIMITARREMGDKLHGMGLGANDYITKPFNPEELQARVGAHLRIKTLEKELSAKRELEVALKMSVTLQHEINNPLTGAIGNLELLKDWREMSGEEIDQSVADILSLALRIKEIVKKMSRLSKVASTQYIEGSEMIDIERSLEERG
ncbi:MAG: response regulator [Candidatus Nitrospinota bacterium M3_3B_026]